MSNVSRQTEASAVAYLFADMELVREAACREPMNAPSAYTLLLVIEGEGKLLLKTGKTRLHRGICVLLAPGTVNMLEAGEVGLTFYRLRFDAIGRGERDAGTAEAGRSVFDALLEQAVMPCSSFSSLLLLVESLYRHYLEQDELERLENQIRFQQLLLSILRQYRSGSGENDLLQAVQRSIEHVREHYDQPFTVDQLAELTGTSRWRYTQLFKEATGQMPIDFVNTVRIEKAQQLLMMTGDKLNDIAQSVGYSNEYYFNRKFKQMVGVTPGQYRSGYETHTRIFAPFLEDYLVALGVTPVMQFSHKLWGRQDYLGMREVPDFDITSGDWKALTASRPEFIILDGGYRRWSLENCSRISPVFKFPYTGEDWRVTLEAFGTILGRKKEVSLAIENHEVTIADARQRLIRSARGESVAVLRISSKAVYLYGGGKRGYTGPLLYGGLGLAEPDIVRKLLPYERRVSLTREELARIDADHLFIAFDKEHGEDAGRQLLETPEWKQVPAVKGNRVHEVDFMAWMNYGVLSHNCKINDVLRVLG
ncbi:MAG: AraC family transcriptional regulator [Paenibacillus sp.]|jgi:AraC-like DNA-binding protein/ABC-type Fe3+-hydroxamate transport system substrate-binding protein|nr:AraC family transcriptional regulator [Paenibacillus sp.]